MAKTDYGKYIIKDCIKKAERSEAWLLSIDGERLGGIDWTFHWVFMTEPMLMIDYTMVHDFDQVLGFTGGNPLDIRDFHAEIELTLGEEKKINIIDSPCMVYIPAGLMHGPLNFKRIEKPIMYWDTSLTPKYTRREITNK